MVSISVVASISISSRKSGNKKKTQHGNTVLNRFDVDYGHIRLGGRSSISMSLIFLSIFVGQHPYLCRSFQSLDITL